MTLIRDSMVLLTSSWYLLSGFWCYASYAEAHPLDKEVLCSNPSDQGLCPYPWYLVWYIPEDVGEAGTVCGQLACLCLSGCVAVNGAMPAVTIMLKIPMPGHASVRRDKGGR